MNAKRGQLGEGARESHATVKPAVDDARASGIGMGKKVGLYGTGFLILGLLIVVVVMYLIGYFAPLEGMEGVGP